MSGSSSSRGGDVDPNKQIGIEAKPHKELIKLYGEPRQSKDRAKPQDVLTGGGKAGRKEKKKKNSVGAGP